jgi:hypothetical protein
MRASLFQSRSALEKLPRKVRATLGRVRVAVVLAVWLSLARAGASETIVAASTDAGFTAALQAALVSAGMSLVVVHDSPPFEVSDLTGGARRLADRASATAAVALVFGDDGATLLAYDHDVDRVLVRSLPYHAPLTEAQAAELARTARAMLHALRVTPDIDAPPPHPTEAAEIRERAALPAPPSSAPAVASPSVLALELVGGARLGTANATAAEHGAVAVVWRPDAPGVALSGSFVPSRSVETMAFSGSVSDIAFAVTGRVPLQIAARWTIVGEGGLALHRIRIAGTIAGAGGVESVRYDPALRAGGTALFRLRRDIDIGIGLSVDGLLRRQDYSLDGAALLALPVVQLTVGVALSAVIL